MMIWKHTAAYEMKLFFTHATCVDSLSVKSLEGHIIGFSEIDIFVMVLIQGYLFYFEYVSTIIFKIFREGYQSYLAKRVPSCDVTNFPKLTLGAL